MADASATTRRTASSTSRTARRSACSAACLFTRIVPTLKDIGLWGPKMRQTFADMGVIGYETTDLDAVMAEDETIAEDLDRSRADIPHRRSHRGRERLT